MTPPPETGPKGRGSLAASGGVSGGGVNNVRRVTANLPADLLSEAQEVTKKGITDTLVQGLKLVGRSRAYEKAMKLKGKLHLDLNIDELRGRPRR